MILSDGDIKNALYGGKLVIDPYDDRCLQPASYDIHLHANVMKPNLNLPMVLVEPDITDGMDFWLETSLPQVLYPGDVMLGRTIERFDFPRDIVGRLEGVSTLGRWFIQVHITAGFFDPKFKGTATIEIKNQGPFKVRLSPGMRIGQMSFSYTQTPARQTYGEKNRYYGQVDPTPPRARPEGVIWLGESS